MKTSIQKPKNLENMVRKILGIDQMRNPEQVHKILKVLEMLGQKAIAVSVEMPHGAPEFAVWTSKVIKLGEFVGSQFNTIQFGYYVSLAPKVGITTIRSKAMTGKNYEALILLGLWVAQHGRPPGGTAAFHTWIASFVELSYLTGQELFQELAINDPPYEEIKADMF